MVSEKVKRFHMLKLGKDSSKVSQQLEFHVTPLKDIQSLLDGETMWTLLLQVFSASNHIASLVNLIHQPIHWSALNSALDLTIWTILVLPEDIILVSLWWVSKYSTTLMTINSSKKKLLNLTSDGWQKLSALILMRLLSLRMYGPVEAIWDHLLNISSEEWK